MRRLLLGVVLALLALPAPAHAGWFVFQKGNEVWAARDDGSAAQVIARPADANGYDLSQPGVAPSGDLVVFSANGNIYKWQAGVTTKVVSGTVTASLLTSYSDPEVTADNRVVYELEGYASQYVCDLYGCGYYPTDRVVSIKSTPLEGEGGGEIATGCDGGAPVDPSPNPANSRQVAFVGCSHWNGSAHEYEMAITDGDSRWWLSVDDETQWDPSFSLDGTRVVVAEGGTEPGIWVYPGGETYIRALEQADGSKFASPRYIAGDRIAFVAQGDIWTIPASCDGCTLAGSATRVTQIGDIRSIAWTSSDSFRTSAAPPPPPPPAPPPPPPPDDRTTVQPAASLVLSALTMRPSKLRPARRGRSVVARGGARIAYVLSDSARVTFTVRRAVRGRRVGGRCVKATRRNRARRPCTRLRTVGAFTHDGVKGPNALRFSGRVRGRRLAAGRYRLVAVARDATRVSAPLSVGFRARR